MSSPVVQPRSRMPRFAEVAVERARLTVVPRARTRAARMPFVAMVSLVLLGGVVGLLLFNTSMQQASFAATALEGQANTLAARQQTLEMQLDRLRDPQRIASAALRLDMVQACSPAFIELGTGKVTGAPCAATAAGQLRINPLPPRKPAVINPQPKVVHVPAPPTTLTGTRTGSADTGGEDTGTTARGGKKNQGGEHQQPQQPHGQQNDIPNHTQTRR